MAELHRRRRLVIQGMLDAVKGHLPSQFRDTVKQIVIANHGHVFAQNQTASAKGLQQAKRQIVT